MSRSPLIAAAALGLVTLVAASPAPPDALALYRAQCAGCHGAAMQGGDGPPLRGKLVAAEKPDDLYKIVRNGMPLDNPGSLTDAQAKALTALIVAANRPR